MCPKKPVFELFKKEKSKNRFFRDFLKMGAPISKIFFSVDGAHYDAYLLWECHFGPKNRFLSYSKKKKSKKWFFKDFSRTVGRISKIFFAVDLYLKFTHLFIE